MKKLVTLLSLMAFIFIGCPEPTSQEASEQSGETPPATHTHSFDETKWKSDATGHWHECSCGEKQEGSFAAHSYDWKEQTPSTDTKPGTLAGECTVCNFSTTKAIPVGCVYVKGGTVDGTSTGLNMIEGVFVGRKVTLSDFFMGRHEVTQAEWKAVMGQDKNPSKFKEDKLPVENVSWYDSVYFCNALSEKLELTPAYTIINISVDSSGSISSATVGLVDGATGYRLPTEAEWEYAARGGKPSTEEGAPWNYQWAGTNEESSLKAYAWYSETPDVDDKTHEVGTKTENSLGIYDMSGNVWEWCWDWHDDDPKAGDGGSTSVTDPTGPETEPESGSYRVSRGGCWVNNASYCRVYGRNSSDPGDRGSGLGFRVVRPAGTAEQSQ